MAPATQGSRTRRGDPLPSRRGSGRTDREWLASRTGPGRSTAQLRQHHAGSRADPRNLGLGARGRSPPGRPRRIPHDASQQRLHLRRGSHTGVGYRTERPDVRDAVPSLSRSTASHREPGCRSSSLGQRAHRLRRPRRLHGTKLGCRRDAVARLRRPEHRRQPTHRRRRGPPSLVQDERARSTRREPHGR